MRLLTVQNAKTSKGESLGYLTGILYLAPYNVSGYQVCPKASKGCAAACLYTAGRGNMPTVKAARIAKTLLFFENREYFVNLLKDDIRALQRQAARKGLTPCIRLNGTSDISFETLTDIIQSFPDIQFYDYTKIAQRVQRNTLPNYHLTFSLSEDNTAQALTLLSKGYSVAAVFESTLPSQYLGSSVITGDSHDLRFLDQRGVIVGLTAKGKAKKDATGFTRRLTTKESEANNATN
jgi:hypothetical protein